MRLIEGQTSILAAAGAGLALALMSGCGAVNDSLHETHQSPRHHAVIDHSSFRLPSMPPLVNAGTTIVPLQRGIGSASLGSVRLAAGTVTFQVSCAGPGALTVSGWLSVQPCDGHVIFTNQYDMPADQQVRLRVNAPKWMHWEIQGYDNG
jgi:hypothetical protein